MNPLKTQKCAQDANSSINNDYSTGLVSSASSFVIILMIMTAFAVWVLFLVCCYDYEM
jgi:hypothetical protein